MNADVSVDSATPGASVSFATFHDGLAPYGEWVNVGAYGPVWRPQHVGAGWRPYFYGRWEWTDEGWLWVSDEPWGWAAYHYGRWAYDSYYGWVWIPGYQWAPAWVTWRYSPEYIGWAPLGPGFSVYVTSYPTVYGWWTFVPCHRFVGVPVHSVAFTGRQISGIYGVTHPAPPRVAMGGVRGPAWGGPARPFIEQRVGRPITPVRVQPVASPRLIGTVERAGLVQVYRPEARLPVTHGGAPAAMVGLPAMAVGATGPGATPRPAARAQPAPGAIVGTAPAGATSPRPVQGPTAVSAPHSPQGRPSQPTQAHTSQPVPGGYRPASPAMTGSTPSTMLGRQARPVQGGYLAPSPGVTPPPRTAPSAPMMQTVPQGSGAPRGPAPAAPPARPPSAPAPVRTQPQGANAPPPPSRALATATRAPTYTARASPPIAVAPSGGRPRGGVAAPVHRR